MTRFATSIAVLFATAAFSHAVVVTDLSKVSMTVTGGTASVEADVFSNPGSFDGESQSDGVDGNFFDDITVGIVNNGTFVDARAAQDLVSDESGLFISSFGYAGTSAETDFNDATANASSYASVDFTIAIEPGAGDQVAATLFLFIDKTHEASTGVTSFEYSLYDNTNDNFLADDLIESYQFEGFLTGFEIDVLLPAGDFTLTLEGRSEFNEIQGGEQAFNFVSWEAELAIPEPASLALLGVGVLLAHRRRA